MEGRGQARNVTGKERRSCVAVEQGSKGGLMSHEWCVERLSVFDF